MKRKRFKADFGRIKDELISATDKIATINGEREAQDSQ